MFHLTLAIFMTLLGLAQDASAQRSPSEQARDAIAATEDLGESAPDWLVDAETYAIGYDPGAWEALAASKVNFITHCPVNKEFFERCHALGIRCFPYVTFYQGWASRTYEDLNLKDHPEFIQIDVEGNLVRTGFWETEDAKNMYTTCPNVTGYQDAMVAWVRKIMELGADGVFVDNLGSRVECYGPKFGKHEHIYEDQNHAFAMLLKRVREVVKEYKPEGAILGNSASPLNLPREYWKYLDAEMLESYICTWVSTERWMDWHNHWHKQGVDLQPFVRAGKQIQALSYLGHTPYGTREDAFFCYASARLGGFVWNGGVSLADPETAILHQIRLGKPLADEQEQNEIFLRYFERGFVVVNPQREKSGQIKFDAPIQCTQLVDIAGTGAASWNPLQGAEMTLDTSTKHLGKSALRLKNSLGNDCYATQTIDLQQKEPLPLHISGWSKAQDVTGEDKSAYSVYLDITYNDNSHDYGIIAPFNPGTHDWEKAELIFTPKRPITTFTVNLLLRNRTGTAWFDDISILEGADVASGVERLKNGDFEQTASSRRLIDLEKTDFMVDIPAYSGRVFLYGAGSADELTKSGPVLQIITEPGLGEVRFRVDGFDYWTHCGMWTTEFVMGSNFGKFDITFDEPGKHTIEIIDVIPSDMKVPAGYNVGEKLGEFMDPSQPTRVADGRKFRFREWSGAVSSTNPVIELEVNDNTVLKALFDITLEDAGG